jgi:hypothetical protein
VKIILAVPGARFTRAFWRSWTGLIQAFERFGVDYSVRNAYSADIYNCRNAILTDATGFDRSRVPFDGAIDYDWIVWIDSDLKFDPKDIFQLVGHEGVDIVSGIVPTSPSGHTALGWYDRDDERGPYMEKYTTKGIGAAADDEGLVEIDFAGFALLAVRRGVFESLEFPWFRTVIASPYGEEIQTSEDIGWCWRAQLTGWRIYADVNVRAGHEKQVVIQP